jgi:protein-S-isoprenylcysteine O-methyltransferase Ste14
MTIRQPGAHDPVRSVMRVPVPWVFVLAYVAGVGLEHLVRLKFHAEAPLSLVVAGACLFCAGAVVAGWSWALFHKAGTTRVPGQPSTALVTSGPYRRSRNPMYVGLSLAYLGEAGMLKQLGPVLVLPLILAYLNWLVIPVEETRLREVFGDAYDQYCASVRRWV